MNQRLIHDCAFAMATTLLGMLHHDESDSKELFEALYQVCKTGLEAYCLRDDRMQRRLRPMEN